MDGQRLTDLAFKRIEYCILALAVFFNFRKIFPRTILNTITRMSVGYLEKTLIRRDMEFGNINRPTQDMLSTTSPINNFRQNKF